MCESVEVSLGIPGFLTVTWRPNRHERKAAWELYVELITRISVEEMRSGEGILRESLKSLYSIFESTRVILKKYGTVVAKPKRKKNATSFGVLSVEILNRSLRPFLTKWHPILQEYESRRDKNASVKEHEDNWELNSKMRTEMEEVRKVLVDYSYYLAKIAKVTPLTRSVKGNSIG